MQKLIRRSQVGQSLAWALPGPRLHSLSYEGEVPDLDNADIVIVGCAEQRGAALLHPSTAPSVVRSEFYSLYQWHNDVKLADEVVPLTEDPFAP